MTYSGGKQNSVLIVSGSQHSRETIADVFSATRYSPVATRNSAADTAARLLLDTPFSLIFINTPLPMNLEHNWHLIFQATACAVFRYSFRETRMSSSMIR